MDERDPDLTTDAAAKRRRREIEEEDDYDAAYVNPYMSVLSRGVRRGKPWLARRRAKVVAELERNRRGEYKVPTWVLVAALGAIVTFWTVIVILN